MAHQPGFRVIHKCGELFNEVLSISLQGACTSRDEREFLSFEKGFVPFCPKISNQAKVSVNESLYLRGPTLTKHRRRIYYGIRSDHAVENLESVNLSGGIPAHPDFSGMCIILSSH